MIDRDRDRGPGGRADGPATPRGLPVSSESLPPQARAGWLWARRGGRPSDHHRHAIIATPSSPRHHHRDMVDETMAMMAGPDWR